MFVFSLKATNLKRIIFIALAAVLIATSAYFLFFSSNESKSIMKNVAKLKAETADERIAFISQCGYEVTADPMKVEEIIIPEEFDEDYKEYNEIQKSQGFDLENFKGCRVKKWTYEVTNYDDKNKDSIIEANLLIYNGVIVGADIQNLAQDGFLKPLSEKS